MAFDPTLAAIRFGMGLSPRVSAPQGVENMLGFLAGPDRAALAYPIQSFKNARPDPLGYMDLRRAERDASGTARAEKAREARTAWSNTARSAQRKHPRQYRAW